MRALSVRTRRTRARARLRPAALLGALAAALLAACGDAGPARRPNVVLIVVDTLRADVLLEQRVETPNLAQLAKDGAAFESAFSHAPMTLPSHTSLFASALPFETGVVNNGMPVPTDLPLLPERFRAGGYRTEAVISLASLQSAAGRGLDRSFETYDMSITLIEQAPTILAKLTARIDELAGEDREARQPFFLFAHFSDPHQPYNAHGSADHRAEILLDGEVLTVVTTSEMTKWDREVELAPGAHALELRSDDPFLVQWFQVAGADVRTDWEGAGRAAAATHLAIGVWNDAQAARACRLQLFVNDEIEAPEGYVERYLGEVRFADRYVGALLEHLRARGLYDDTIVVFTSDHGEGLGQHGEVGHVANLFDELLHVPLIVKPVAGDARLERLRERSGELFALVDLAPTLLDLADLPAAGGYRGASVLRRDPGAAGRVLIAETHTPEAAHNLVCARDERFKMILDADSGELAMFDLAADPGEEVDVYAERNGERPEWPALLRGVAAAAARVGTAELDDATREALRALGYLGGEDS